MFVAQSLVDDISRGIQLDAPWFVPGFYSLGKLKKHYKSS